MTVSTETREAVRTQANRNVKESKKKEEKVTIAVSASPAEKAEAAKGHSWTWEQAQFAVKAHMKEMATTLGSQAVATVNALLGLVRNNMEGVGGPAYGLLILNTTIDREVREKVLANPSWQPDAQTIYRRHRWGEALHGLQVTLYKKATKNAAAAQEVQVPSTLREVEGGILQTVSIDTTEDGVLKQFDNSIRYTAGRYMEYKGLVIPRAEKRPKAKLQIGEAGPKVVVHLDGQDPIRIAPNSETHVEAFVKSMSREGAREFCEAVLAYLDRTEDAEAEAKAESDAKRDAATLRRVG